MQSARTKTKWKILFVVFLIICYFSFLTMISYLRAPAEELCRPGTGYTAADFKVMEEAGKNANITGENIRFHSSESGNLSGIYTEVDLREAIKYDVRFTTNSSEDGGQMFVDLCAEGYDNPEQEYTIGLKKGIYEYHFALKPGENYPEKARLRIFTLDEVDANLTKLSIHEAIPKDKKNIIVGSIIIMLFAGFIAIAINMVNKKQDRSKPNDTIQ